MITPKEFYNLFTEYHVSKFSLMREIEGILKCSPSCVALFLEELEEERLHHYQRLNWYDELPEPPLGPKFYQIMEEYGVVPKPKPTEQSFTPHHLYHWAISELHKGSKISTNDQALSKLPERLDTPEAWNIWNQAKEHGLISEDFKWMKGLQLLACFAQGMSIKLQLGKGHNNDNTPRINWRIFEDTFDIPKGKLRSNLNDIKKTGDQPIGIDIINKIFG